MNEFTTYSSRNRTVMYFKSMLLLLANYGRILDYCLLHLIFRAEINSEIQSTIDNSKLIGLFLTRLSSDYPKCNLICTSGKLNL